MNPKYVWVTEGIELLTLFVIMPGLSLVTAYASWRGKSKSFNREWYGTLCVASGVASVVLFGLAKWMNADVRSAQYLLQLVCFLFSCLLFGVCVGCCFSVLLRMCLRMWQWHKSTHLR